MESGVLNQARLHIPPLGTYFGFFHGNFGKAGKVGSGAFWCVLVGQGRCVMVVRGESRSGQVRQGR